MSRRNWAAILVDAALIVRSYSVGVTLRQLYYRLVAAGTLVNDDWSYQTLSKVTAAARRDDRFPRLIDDRRTIIRYSPTFTSPRTALDWLRDFYRRDRTEGQPWTIYIGCEKAGLVRQLGAWFGHMGIPIIALGGWSSQSFAEDVTDDVLQEGDRPSVLLYVGDFDPSGVYIDRTFTERVGVFDCVERVAVNLDHLRGLPYNPYPVAKGKNPNIPRFMEEYGPRLIEMGYPPLVQFEVDAIEPNTLRGLVAAAISRYWDDDAYDAVLEQEARDRENLP